MNTPTARAASNSRLAGDIQDAFKGYVELHQALSNIVLNARMIPDPSMQGATDIYTVPMDDIDAARNLITARAAKGSE